MFITLIFLAGLMAVVAWWLVRQSINSRPWVANVPLEDADTASFARPVEKIALWVLLAVIGSLFCLLISAYSIRMQALGDWRPLPEPGLLWANTAALVLSSIFMQRARNAAARQDIDGLKTGLNVGGAFAWVFVIGQLLAWRQLTAAGYVIAANPANAFFYLITGLHGLHMLGGLVAWGRSTVSVWRGRELSGVLLSVELCTIYWHFLLIVWMVLFGLMLAT